MAIQVKIVQVHLKIRYFKMAYVTGAHYSISAILVLFSVLVIPGVNSLLTQALKNQIFSMVESTRQCHHMPGLALSIVSRTGGRLVEKGFGNEDIASRAQITERSLFPIGSTTKAFTSTLLAILMQKHSNLTTRYIGLVILILI